MLRGTICTLMLAMLACTEPGRAPSAAGAWRLVGVDSLGLPASLSRDLTIVGGALDLRTDGTYEERVDARIGGAPATSIVRGKWRESGEMIELLDRVVGLPFVGYWEGGSMVVHAEHRMAFVR